MDTDKAFERIFNETTLDDIGFGINQGEVRKIFEKIAKTAKIIDRCYDPWWTINKLPEFVLNAHDCEVSNKDGEFNETQSKDFHRIFLDDMREFAQDDLMVCFHLPIGKKALYIAWSMESEKAGSLTSPMLFWLAAFNTLLYSKSDFNPLDFGMLFRRRIDKEKLMAFLEWGVHSEIISQILDANEYETSLNSLIELYGPQLSDPRRSFKTADEKRNSIDVDQCGFKNPEFR